MCPLYSCGFDVYNIFSRDAKSNSFFSQHILLRKYNFRITFYWIFELIFQFKLCFWFLFFWGGRNRIWVRCGNDDNRKHIWNPRFWLMLNANKKKTYIGENFLNPSKKGPKSCFERSSIYNSSHIYVYRVQTLLNQKETVHTQVVNAIVLQQYKIS